MCGTGSGGLSTVVLLTDQNCILSAPRVQRKKTLVLRYHRPHGVSVSSRTAHRKLELENVFAVSKSLFENMYYCGTTGIRFHMPYLRCAVRDLEDSALSSCYPIKIAFFRLDVCKGRKRQIFAITDHTECQSAPVPHIVNWS